MFLVLIGSNFDEEEMLKHSKCNSICCFATESCCEPATAFCPDSRWNDRMLHACYSLELWL
jgi:hypothetical protein